MVVSLPCVLYLTREGGLIVSCYAIVIGICSIHIHQQLMTIHIWRRFAIKSLA